MNQNWDDGIIQSNQDKEETVSQESQMEKMYALMYEKALKRWGEQQLVQIAKVKQGDARNIRNSIRVIQCALFTITKQRDHAVCRACCKSFNLN